MNYFRILLTLGLCLPLIFATSEKEMMELRKKAKGLSFSQRTMLLLASKVKPEVFHGLQVETLLIDDKDHEYIDAVFVDLRSLLAQVKNLEPDASLPEVDHIEIIDFCAGWVCLYFELGLKTGNTKIVGAHDITSETEFTPTSFRNTYTIPHLKWTSPGFLFNLTTPLDVDPGAQHLYRDVHISIDGMKTVFEANYSHDPVLGFQVSDLSIDFSLASYIHYISTYELVYSNASKVVEGPFGGEYAADVIQTWEDYRDNYIETLEFKINCVLSNGRKDPEGCDVDGSGYYDHVKYYKMNIVQLFETLGLASGFTG